MLAFTLLLALGVGIPVVFGFASGAALIPRNDDWVYRRIALELADTGQLSLHSVTTMLIGLIVAAQPLLRFATTPQAAFAIAGVGFAIAAVVSAFALTRQFLDPWRAALAASLVLVFPGYLAYATSFMTDAPTLATQLGCLALGVRAIRRSPARIDLLVAAVVVGFVGFSIREFAIAAPVTVLGSAIWADRRRRSLWALALAFVASCIGLYLLKLTLPGQVVSGGVGTGSLVNVFPSITSICLVASPAALVAFRDRFRTWSRFDLAVGAELGLIVVCFHLVHWIHDGAVTTALLDNLTSQYGVPSSWYIIGGRPPVLGDPLWLALNVYALAAIVVTSSVAAAVVGSYVRRCRASSRGLASVLGSRVGILAIFVTAVSAGLVLYATKYALFDRYFWPLIPPLATLLMYRARTEVHTQGVSDLSPRPSVLVIGSWLALLGLSLLYMLNSFAFDVARWQGGERLVARGIPAERVDAGYEWVGQHQADLPEPNPPPGNEIFYEAWWPDRQVCGVVGGAPPGAGIPTIDVVPWKLFLVGGPQEQLYLYRRESAPCRS